MVCKGGEGGSVGAEDGVRVGDVAAVSLVMCSR